MNSNLILFNFTCTRLHDNYCQMWNFKSRPNCFIGQSSARLKISFARPLRDLFYSTFQFLTIFNFFFHLLLILLPLDFFCRSEVSVCRYNGRTSMVCRFVAHHKLIELSCAMHVSPTCPPLESPSSLPCWFKLLTNRSPPLLPLLCRVNLFRLCLLWLLFEQI